MEKVINKARQRTLKNNEIQKITIKSRGLRDTNWDGIKTYTLGITDNIYAG